MKHRTLLILVAIALALAGAVPARGTVAAALAARPLARIRIAFTQNNNVYIMNADGSGRTVVTTRGSVPSQTNPNYIAYPWYQWSPDGKRLALERDTRDTTALLLMSPRGTLLRTLVAYVGVPGVIDPAWAVDADQVAYVASMRTGGSGMPLSRVAAVDLQGTTRALWSFPTGLGCGGGPDVPAGQLRNQELGYVNRPTLQWSARDHWALFSTDCAGGGLSTLNYSASPTAQVARSSFWAQGAVSPLGAGAAVTSCSGVQGICVALISLSGQHIVLRRIIGPGELPTWSPDGEHLYFVRGTVRSTVPLRSTDPDRFGAGATTDTFFTSSIYSANADGSNVKRLASIDAYALGTLQPTHDGRYLVFSRIDNDTNLWRHRLPGNTYTPEMVTRYGPRVSIQLLNVSNGKLTALVRNAGRPAVQP